MKSFYFKLLATFLTVNLVFGALLFLVFSRMLRENNLDNVSDHLHSVCLAAAYRLESREGIPDAATADRLAKDLGRLLGVRITVIRADGTVIGDTDHDPAGMDNHLRRPEIAGATLNATGRAVRHSRTLEKDLLYVAIRVPESGPTQCFIRASLRITQVNAIYQHLAGNFLWVAGGLILLSVLTCAFITRRLSRPVTAMRSAADQISRGDLNTRVFVDSRDEFQELAAAFNRMTEEIQALVGRLSSQKEESEAILTAVREGLVLIGRDQRIVKANRTFLAQVQSADAAGKPYWEVIRNPRFAEVLRLVRQEGGSRREEISFGDTTFLCSFAYLSSREEVVALFFDISELKRLETIKKDLVVNISHEFKTPLTAIRGFAEALAEEPERSGEYLEIIKRNAERLSAITNDLLLLARLEYKESALQREPVDLAALVRDVAAIVQTMLKEKGLELSIQAGEGLPAVSGDRYLLEQAVTNLLENAIKYTDSGRVSVSLRRTNGAVSVEVSDTGIGIAAEHLPRIFERFYVVDKSRSRRQSGTGLGLAIVKNIILQHGGEISVRSTPGQGTVFSFVIPVG